jgi:hypothetical protein
MIKNRNERQQERQPTLTHALKNSEQLKPVISTFGDVVADIYTVKEICTCDTAARVSLSIANKLNEASRAGYRYVDRVQANASESVLIFIKVDNK